MFKHYYLICAVLFCSRPAEDRTIPLNVIAERTRLSIEDVEYLLMKSLSVSSFFNMLPLITSVDRFGTGTSPLALDILIMQILFMFKLICSCVIVTHVPLFLTCKLKVTALDIESTFR